MQSAPSHTTRSGDVPAPEADVVDLSVVIVNYNVREFLEQALRSVRRASARRSVEVFVVDNNSVDGSVEMVRAQFPEVHLLVNDDNVGFGRANNQAIRRARGRYVLILNPDTIVAEDTFDTLLRFMDDHPEAGAVGCKILNPDGTFAPESRRAFPRPSVAFYRMVGLSRLFPRSRVFGRYNMTYLPRDEVAEVDALSGSCMLVRHEALYRNRSEASADTPTETPYPEPQTPNPEPGTPNPEPRTRNPEPGAGLFDEDFFMYGEDLDWCYRIQQAGWKIFYTPEAEIIHYKGESTKKGELRYVRLFYGAMLHFTEKHVENRYSRLFAALLRVGILVRAGLTVVGGAARRLGAPLFDAGLVYVAVSLLGVLYPLFRPADLPLLFFTTVAPAYAVATAAGIGAAGGYRRRRRDRLRPAWTGALVGLLVVSAVSFFVKDIAFSRFVVLTSFPAAALLLSARRLVRRRRRGRTGLARRALVVGPRAEAERLQRMLDAHPHPPFTIDGYVPPDDARPANGRSTDAPRCLGTMKQVRDLVRLRSVDEVVFAVEGLRYGLVLGLVQQLHDLPVQFRILAEGRDHLIGKASIHDLSLAPLIEAEEAFGMLRTTLARRAFEIPVALAGLLLHPFLWTAARLAGPDAAAARLARRTRQMPAVLTGRRRLVGCRPEDRPLLPSDWNLGPGVFTVADTLPSPRPEDVTRAYTLYVQNQSAALDWNVVLRALEMMR